MAAFAAPTDCRRRGRSYTPRVSVAVDLDDAHRLSVDEYERLVEEGFFDGQLVELIDGLLLDTSPKSPAHENVVQWLMAWLFDRVDRSLFQLRVSAPLRLPRGEPEPDIMVCQADLDRSRHPSRAELVIEVAASSLVRDLEVKPSAYAEATADYWVVDLAGRRVVCHRDPSGGRFRTVETFSEAELLEPLSLGVEPLPLAALFAAA